LQPITPGYQFVFPQHVIASVGVVV